MFGSIALYVMSETSDSEEDDNICLRTLHKQIRGSMNVFQIPEEKFIAMFRINKQIFHMLLEEMTPKFPQSTRSTYIRNELRLGTFLLFLATGSYQASIGREYFSSMTKSTVSLIISECLDIFEKHICKKWIHLNKTEEEENESKLKFYGDGGIPGIVGCVDGTHIPGEGRDGENGNHHYYNRKGFYSLNVMVICDHRMMVTFVDARHPGANHDAFIWEHSKANQFFKSTFDSGKRNTWLLGDGGYKLMPYMMTPYRNPRTPQEILYNTRHCQLRNIIERLFGVLKNRFRCLIGSRGLHYAPGKVKQMVNTCCALHNICIHYKNEWQSTDTSLTAELTQYSVDDEVATIEEDSAAVAIRNNIASNMS